VNDAVQVTVLCGSSNIFVGGKLRLIVVEPQRTY